MPEGVPGSQTPAAPILDTPTLLLLLLLMERLAKTEREEGPALPSIETEEPIVESMPLAAEQRTPDIQHPPPQPLRTHRLAVVLLVVCVLISMAVIAVSLLPLVTASATVTIIPVQREITTTTTLTVVTTGAANAAQQHIPGRRLSSLTLSQQETVPSTGVGHQPARAAMGRITFYNASPATQTILAGTLLTTSAGVQVMTEQDAVIPAVAYPILGQVTVPAHAVLAGPAGNIGAGEIYGPCCRLNVSAVNAAFGGGQTARSYPIVSTQDLQGVATSLVQSLSHSVQSALATQVQPGETLITPVPCQPKVTSDHHAGDEAAQVQITVDETCSGKVFTTHAYHDLIKQSVTQEATKQLGEGYILTGDIQARIDHVTPKGQDEVELAVTGTGTWGYQFSQNELGHLKTMMAGKSETQARAVLLQVVGVQSVSITLKHTTTVPTDTRTIQMVLVEML